MTTNEPTHEPVLLKKVISALDPRPGEFVVDGTVDGGGHAEALLAAVGKEGKLLGIDLDPDMLAISRERLKGTILAQGNYADLPEILSREKLPKVDCLLLDLGFSSAQLTLPRGFSFMRDDPLIMTYSPDEAPLKDLLRNLSEEELADIIYNYGGERMSRRVARAIYEHERQRGIETTGELRGLIEKTLPKNYEHGRISRATRTFQALRIYANHELENLGRVLEVLPQVMNRGGRVGIVTFHSLEDRIVKQKFRALEKEGLAVQNIKKPITADKEEIKKNPRSRSAKFRIITFK
ncbi:MAG: 16S rRNA (cytosine(1402)-N(4))-methyltransferase RsmH [Candidatus Liptonbacteria bacterium]